LDLIKNFEVVENINYAIARTGNFVIAI